MWGPQQVPFTPRDHRAFFGGTIGDGGHYRVPALAVFFFFSRRGVGGMIVIARVSVKGWYVGSMRMEHLSLSVNTRMYRLDVLSIMYWDFIGYVCEL